MGIALLVILVAATNNISNRCVFLPGKLFLAIPDQKNLKCTQRYTDKKVNINTVMTKK